MTNIPIYHIFWKGSRLEVRCPQCGKRLFDLLEEGRGLIEIKCPACKIRLGLYLETLAQEAVTIIEQAKATE